MNSNPYLASRPVRRRTAASLALAVALLATSCSAGADADPTALPGAASAPTEPAAPTPTDAPAEPSVTSQPTATVEPEVSGFYNGDVRDIEVSFDRAEFDDAVDEYRESEKKKWIKATVTIDGVEYTEVGMRLKGNSSLFELGFSGGEGEGFGTGSDDGDAEGGFGDGVVFECVIGGLPPGFEGDPGAEGDTAFEGDPAFEGEGGPGFPGDGFSNEPEDLPWLIRLDKYVDGQAHQGRADYVVRSNDTDTALNEAVALALLDKAGLATQQSAPVRFSVNGSDATLRLVIEHPDEIWSAENLGEGSLFKADSTGDYSYRGDDPDDYTDAWDQKAGDDDFAPLMSFLDFVNNSNDEEFAAGIEDRLDTASFARYLALQDIISNWDSIEGPGNNSYLHFDPEGKVTVVAWDHNLALMGDGFPGGDFDPSDFDPSDPDSGVQIVGGLEADFELPEDCDFPEGFEPPDDFDPSDGGGLGGFGSNALATRFREMPGFDTLYDEAKADLLAELVDSGFAADTIAAEADVLREQASDLVEDEAIAEDAEWVQSSLVVD